MKKIGISIAVVIFAIIGVFFFLSQKEIEATERPTAQDIAGYANKNEVLVPNIAQDIYHSHSVTGSSAVSISFANQKVIPLGRYVPEWNCTVTFGTYMETPDGDFILGYVLLGGHSGYAQFLRTLDADRYPFQETDYGVIVDVSQDEVPANIDDAVEVAAPTCGLLTVLFEGDTFNGGTNMVSVSKSSCVLEDGEISFGNSGTPVLQDGKLVGWVTKGDAKGSPIFQMTNASVIME